MSRFRPSLYFATVFLLGLLLAAEIACALERERAARRTKNQLIRRLGEWRNLSMGKPAPTVETAAALGTELADAQQTLAAVSQELQGRGPAAGQLRAADVPLRRTDAFFDLAAFAERTRETAGRLGIGLKSDEHFGFSIYVNEGPDVGLIPFVFRQRWIAEYLIDALFAAHPAALLSVQRERPSSTAAPAGGRLAVAGDFFEMDPRWTLRAPGTVDALAFRLAFTGPTAVLRDFLNKLAAFELPLIVRAIEVEPAAAGKSGRETTGAAAAAGSRLLRPDVTVPVLIPLVPRALSKFTVTIEFVELAPVGEAMIPNA